MCGICGVLGGEDKDLIKRMCDVIAYRGPDDYGTFVDKGISLGHRRLSIIDLSGGHQPIHNEDESIWVVFNGEIYNFPELKKELEGLGHRFYTHTDTEVLVHSYEEYGDAFVSKLNGMFAFALWDCVKKRLLLARDRAGIKPLYYTKTDGVFLFGSEVKSLLQYPGIKRAVDRQALHYLLGLRYIPGERTMFSGIQKLLPGCILIHEKGESRITGYWDLKMSVDPSKNEGYYVETLRRLLHDSVKRHMISDVPVGSFLSGGIDTSTIVAIASKLTDEPLQTFCMGFGEPTDELAEAKKIAEHFQTDHHEFIIDPYEGFKLFPKAIWHVDMPKINLYPYFVSELASKHVKVVLSGLGSDEIFGGYIDRFKHMNRAEKLRRAVPGPLRPIASSVASELIKLQAKHGKLEWDYTYRDYLRVIQSLDHKEGSYLILVRSLVKEDYENLYSQESLKLDLSSVEDYFRPYFESNAERFVEQALHAEFKTKLVDDFLIVDDAMSMAHSLEARVPFLDSELVSFALTVPSDLKVKGNEGKYILKKAVADILPPQVIKKKKWGFYADSYKWYQKGLKDYAEQMLPDGSIAKAGYFDPEYLNRILNHPLDRRLARHYKLIWTLLSFEIWHRIYIDNDNMYDPKLDLSNFC